MLFLIGVILLLIYFWFKKKYSYWADRGVPSIPGKFPFGNIGDLGRKIHTSDLFKKMYDEHKGKGPGVGIYFITSPTFLITEPDLVKEVLVKNFDSFHDRGIFFNEKVDPLNENIFFLKGQRWKELRAKVTPIFTTGKIKMMFDTVANVADGLVDFLEPAARNREEVEVKEVLTSFTTEVISSVAFGLETKCLGNPDNQFRKVADMVFNPPKYMILKFLLMNSFPSLSKKLGLRTHVKEMTDFFIGVVKDNIEYREKNNVERKDFLQLLIQIKNSEIGMSLNEIAANSFIFLLAGMETSSSVASFTLFELALNQDIQDRLRQEIEEVLSRHDDNMTYDAIMEMKYLDMVFNESLRRYPVVDTHVRKCSKEFKIPNSNIVIPEDAMVLMCTNAFHNDERFFENPTKFDPERFSEQNVKKHNPFAYLPFSKFNYNTFLWFQSNLYLIFFLLGEGPRICIGLRFGTLQTKIVLAKLLIKYKFSVGPKAPIPMKFSPSAAFQSPVGGMWLKIEKVDD